MRRYYRRRSFDFYGYNKSERAEAKRGLVGIDEDVVRIFNGLEGPKRESLFCHYKTHGRGAASYARNTIADWAHGTVKPSAKTLSRLLDLVPKVLDQNDRYDLLKKLYDGHRSAHQENHSLTVVVGRDAAFRQQVTDLAVHLCSKPDTHTLPTYVQKKIDWVCDNDSVVARKIMAAIEKEHSFAIAAAGRVEVENLVRRIEGMGQSLQGTHTIKMPYGTITVHVRQPTLFERIGKFFSS